MEAQFWSFEKSDRIDRALEIWATFLGASLGPPLQANAGWRVEMASRSVIGRRPVARGKGGRRGAGYLVRPSPLWCP